MEGKLKDSSAVISTHIYATGPSHSLEEYLSSRVARLLFIGHPFVYTKEKKSYYRQYLRGKRVKDFSFPLVFRSQFISLFKDMILTFICVVKNKGCDVYVGVDSANALCGVALKKLGLVKIVVYYTIDFVPKRFNNNFLNKIYMKMDSFSVAQADYVWNLSPVMVQEREKRGVNKIHRSKQLTVPVGTEKIIFSKAQSRKKFHVAHMGHLIKKQGVQLLIESISDIVKKVPKFHLEVIGGGEYENTLIALSKELRVEKYITFHGYIKSHKAVEKMLSLCEIGVAPYVDEPDNYVRYTDPGKVKAYLAVGLPVVITKVPEIYKFLEKRQCGIGVNYKTEDLAKTIVELLLDRKRLESYQKNAKNTADEFTWDKIFNKAFSQMI